MSSLFGSLHDSTACRSPAAALKPAGFAGAAGGGGGGAAGLASLSRTSTVAPDGQLAAAPS